MVVIRFSICSVAVRSLRVSVRFFSPSWSKILKIVRMVGALVVVVVVGVGVGCCGGVGLGVGVGGCVGAGLGAGVGGCVGVGPGVGIGVTSFRWLMLVLLVDVAFFPLLEVRVLNMI